MRAKHHSIRCRFLPFYVHENPTHKRIIAVQIHTPDTQLAEEQRSDARQKTHTPDTQTKAKKPYARYTDERQKNRTPDTQTKGKNRTPDTQTSK
jgi:hypothetical protein